MEKVYSLELNNVTIGYNKDPIVKKINLKIKRGQIVSILGPNGCGKTTLIKSLTGQLKIQEGSVSIFGKDENLYSLKDFAKNISVLLTQRINPELTSAFEVAAMGRYPYTGNFGFLTKDDRKKIFTALEDAGAKNFSKKMFSLLSDGQKQRVLLARALCQEPKILILDEPTSYLDIKHRLDFLNLLRRLSARGVTIIMAIHEIDLAQKISDIIVGIKNQSEIYVWQGENLYTSDQLCKLYNVDNCEYNPLLGTCELKGNREESSVFVISSSGKGIPVYRELSRKNIPFTAGILFKNDVDYFFARSLASKIISEESFAKEISEDVFLQAKKEVDKVLKVINCGFENGPTNIKLYELIEYAKEEGKLCMDL